MRADECVYNSNCDEIINLKKLCISELDYRLEHTCQLVLTLKWFAYVLHFNYYTMTTAHRLL